jgi:hypothetical protein
MVFYQQCYSYGWKATESTYGNGVEKIKWTTPLKSRERNRFEKYNSTRRKDPKDYHLPLVTTGLLEIRAGNFSESSFHHILQSNNFCTTPPTFPKKITSSFSETADKILETSFNDHKMFFSRFRMIQHLAQPPLFTVIKV